MRARASRLGGLAIDLELRAAPLGRATSDERYGSPGRGPGRAPGGRTMTAERPAGRPILLVEDDEATRTALRRDLVSRGYRVDEAADGASALARWEARRPDAILLDLGLPDMDGTRVIRRVRREAQTPILVLSARDAETTKVEALELGADDYVTKPFGIAELHARLRALLRRAAGPAADAEGRVQVGTLVLDAARHEVHVAGVAVDLTPREFEVLRVLLAHAGRVVTRGRLLRAVWGEAYSGRGPLRPRLREPGAAQAGGRRPGRRPARPHRHRAGRRLPGPGPRRAVRRAQVAIERAPGRRPILRHP